MAPPDDLRIRVEAAFPGATVELDPRRGDWLITPPSPLEIDGLRIPTINCSDNGRVGAHRIVLTARAVESVGRGRFLAHEVLEDRMRSASAHEMLAARRRLGL